MRPYTSNVINSLLMDNIDFLTDVYEDYCTKHGLPYVSADEQCLSELDERHVNWLNAFNRMWDLAADDDREEYKEFDGPVFLPHPADVICDESTGW